MINKFCLSKLFNCCALVLSPLSNTQPSTGGGNRGRGRGRPGADMGADRGDGRNAIQTLQLRLKRDDTVPGV